MTMPARIAVLGAGTMGHGIAHAALAAGFDTCLYDVAPAALERGRAAIGQIVRKGVELGTPRLSVLEFLHRSLGAKFRPCPLLVQYVKAGRLGRKVGRGVYEYP